MLFALVISAAAVFVVAASKSRETDEFNGFLKEYYATWSTLDPDKAAHFYAKDADLVFYDIAPLKYDHGWQQYRDTFKNSVAPTFASLRITPNDDLKVIRKGSVALTTLTFHVVARMKEGAPLDFDGRHTIFWERRHGHWLIVHEHVSKPL
jgi:ketosteroid isomerase-like protein